MGYRTSQFGTALARRPPLLGLSRRIEIGKRSASSRVESTYDFSERKAANARLCELTRTFFVNLPGETSYIALLLDSDNVILECIAIRQSITTLQATDLCPGAVFALKRENEPCLETGAQVIDPGLAFPSLEGNWQGVAVVLKHPIAPIRNKKIVLLSESPDAVSSLKQVTLIAVHAIEQLWDSTGGLEELVEESTNNGVLDQLQMKLREFEKASSLASLTAGIAHEIRNPLTTARGFLQLFEQRSDSGQDKEYIELTIRELDRIQALLQDFMGLARPDCEHFQEIDARNLTASVYQFLSPEASLCNVELVCDVPEHPVMIRLHPGRIKQVLINLMQNAVHACDKQGHVTLSVHDFDNYITLSIIDNGCGITDLHQLFRPFFTTKQTGTGLGMFVSKHIVEEHYGHIQVDSMQNKGTTVTIYLPKLTLSTV